MGEQRIEQPNHRTAKVSAEIESVVQGREGEQLAFDTDAGKRWLAANGINDPENIGNASIEFKLDNTGKWCGWLKLSRYLRTDDNTLIVTGGPSEAMEAAYVSVQIPLRMLPEMRPWLEYAELDSLSQRVKEATDGG
jgi:hypothetical protein